MGQVTKFMNEVIVNGDRFLICVKNMKKKHTEKKLIVKYAHGNSASPFYKNNRPAKQQ